MVEYEMEEPKETWTHIQLGVKQATAALKRSKRVHASLELDASYSVQSCGTVMDAGMCPFRSAVPPNSHLLTAEQRREQARVSYQRAKKQCHAQLGKPVGHDTLEAPKKKRKLGGDAHASTVRAAPVVPQEWASGPSMFSRQMQRLCGHGLSPAASNW